MAKIRLVVADDEILVRQGLCGLLALEPDFEIIGQVGSGAEALDMARLLTPDVILMDVQMPIMNGVEATRQIVESGLPVRVLVLTTFFDDALIVQAMQAGAHGYLLKDSGAKQVAAAIRSSAQGHTALGAGVAEKMLKRTDAPKNKVLDAFTAREIEVLRLLSSGRTNAEIAQQTGVTEKTVRDHIGNILSKLRLRDRTQAALWARANLQG